MWAVGCVGATDDDTMLGQTINNTLHINNNLELVKILQTDPASQPPTLCRCLGRVSMRDNAISDDSDKLNIIWTSIWTMGILTH